LQKKPSEKIAEVLFPQIVDTPASCVVSVFAWKKQRMAPQLLCCCGKYFSVKGWNIILFGGPQDKTAANALKQQIGEQCISTAGELSLRDTAIF